MPVGEGEYAVSTQDRDGACTRKGDRLAAKARRPNIHAEHVNELEGGITMSAISGKRFF